MIYLVTASKDSSVYKLYPHANAGLDSVLTISKDYTSNLDSDIARAYIKFDIDNLPTYVTASSVELSLQITYAEKLPLEYTIYTNPVTSNWDMGVGKIEDSIEFSGSISWDNQPTINNQIFNTQSFSYEENDIKMDIKNIYNYWTSSVNYGVRLSHTASIEESSGSYGYLKFYSKETNTFRQPLIKIGFDDQEYSTGSLSAVASEKDIVIKSKGLKSLYPLGKLTKFNFVVREKFPTKTFSNIFGYESINYLPQTSYYAIKDVITGLYIIDFGDYTKISCNSNGSYVKLDTTNYPINRPLKFEFLINRDGLFDRYEDDLTFVIK